MKKIMLSLFLALGLLSISCNGLPSGIRKIAKEIVKDQNGGNQNTGNGLIYGDYDYAAAIKSIGSTTRVYRFKKDKTVEVYNCGVSNDKLTIESVVGSYKGFGQSSVVVDLGSGEVTYPWNGKDEIDVSGVAYKLTTTPCPGSSMASKGADFERIEGYWKRVSNAAAQRYYFRRDGVAEYYMCNSSSPWFNVAGNASLTINQQQVSSNMNGSITNFTWNKGATPSGDKLIGYIYDYVRVANEVDPCS